MLRNAHARLLIEARCAGWTRGIDPEPDARQPAPMELAEGVLKQRRAETTPPPGATDGQRLDPANPFRAAAERDPSRFIPVHSQEPEPGIVVLSHAPFFPLVERRPDVTPMVGHRLFRRLEKQAHVVIRSRGPDGHPLWPDGDARRLREVGVHAPEVANGLIPFTLQQRASVGVQRVDPVLEDHASLRRRQWDKFAPPILGAVDETRANPVTKMPRVDVDLDVDAGEALVLDVSVAGKAAIRVDHHPRIMRQIDSCPVVLEFVATVPA